MLKMPTALLTIIFSLGAATLTWLIIEKLVKNYVRERIKAKAEYLSELTFLVFASGFVEIVLYAGSFQLGKPEFILVWTGIKTALRWDRKNKKEKKEEQIIIQRGTYHTFLLGTGLNIILGYLAACLAKGELIDWLK